MGSYGFIITRHVNSKQTNKYWNHCVKLIRTIYPLKQIIIIDDNSNQNYVSSEHKYSNLTIIQSEYFQRGELLPYIYYLKYKWFPNAVIIHDSLFFHLKIHFEKLSVHYKKYRDGLNILEFTKDEYLKQIDPIKKEMNAIIASMQSGLVMDNKTQKEKAERFQSLQEQVASIDKDATTQLSKFRDKMTKEVYAEMEEIITEWSKSNNIDLVMGKIECVYLKEEFEITDSIIEVFKSKELYVELIEEQLLEENEKES